MYVNALTLFSSIMESGTNDKLFVAIFDSNQMTLCAEKCAKDKGLEIKVIPSPRYLTKSCGIAIVFLQNIKEDIERLWKQNGLTISGIYEIKKKEIESKGPKFV